MLASISIDVSHFFDQLEYALGPASAVLLVFLAGVFTLGFVIAWVIRRMNMR